MLPNMPTVDMNFSYDANIQSYSHTMNYSWLGPSDIGHSNVDLSDVGPSNIGPSNILFKNWLQCVADKNDDDTTMTRRLQMPLVILSSDQR